METAVFSFCPPQRKEKMRAGRISTPYDKQGRTILMNHLLLTCGIVLPLFLVMLAGQAASRLNVVKKQELSSIDRLVFRVFLPCSIVRSILQADTSMGFQWPVVWFFIFYQLSAVGIGLLVIPRLFRQPGDRSVLMQNMFRCNYTLFGFALAEALYPVGDGGVAAMLVALTVPFFNVISIIVFESYGEGRHSLAGVFAKMLRNPLLWACLIGLVLRLLPISLPDVILSALGKLGGIASPLALFSIGAGIRLSGVTSNRKAFVFGLLCRLVLMPAIYLPLAYALGLRGPAFAGLLCAIACPAAVSSYSMAKELGGNEELAAQLVAFTTTFSAITLFGLIYVCKVAGVF